nr:DUF4238 domain-containing protein [Pedobacter panaciterrae]
MKQHYLPECYLKEFTNAEGRLHTLDINLLKHKRKVFDEPRFPAAVCRSKNLYTIKPEFSKGFKHLKGLHPMYLEYKFQDYEKHYPALIDKLKRGQDYLQNDDARRLIYTLVDLKIRNPYFRENSIRGKQEPVIDNLFDSYREQIKHIDLRQFPNLSEESMLKTMDDVKASYMNDEDFAQKTHISSMVQRNKDEYSIHQKITDHLLRFEWLMLVSDNEYITTDNPGVSLDKNNVIQNTKFDENFFFLMPLTPSLCIGISPTILDKSYDPRIGKKRLLFGKAVPQMIDIVNQMHGHHLTQYVFANNKALIDRIASRINTGAGL